MQPDIRRIERVLTPEQAKKMRGDDVPAKEPTLTLPGIYVDAKTDEPVFAYLPMTEMISELRAAVLGMDFATTRRAKGMVNASRTFGMTPKAVRRRREGCRATAMSVDQPEQHNVLVDLAGVFTRMLRDLLPEVAEGDHEYVEQVLPEWRMGEDTLWTSGVVNRSSTLPYHYDGANFPTWSAMPVIRRGMRGGYLDVPEYNIVCACRDGWVIFFVGNQLLHGVTPMKPLTPDAYRYSVVYYALKGMKDCFTFAVEQRRAQAERTKRETDTMVLPEDQHPDRAYRSAKT